MDHPFYKGARWLDDTKYIRPMNTLQAQHKKAREAVIKEDWFFQIEHREDEILAFLDTQIAEAYQGAAEYIFMAIDREFKSLALDEATEKVINRLKNSLLKRNK